MSKIVFLTSRFPYPFNKGDQLRGYFQLRSLSENNEVHLFALHDRKVDQEQLSHLSFCKSINVFQTSRFRQIVSLTNCLLNDHPFQVGYFYDESINSAINKLIKQIKPDFIHCHLIRTTEYVKHLKGVEKAIDFMDAFSIGMKKRCDIERNPIKKMLLLSEYQRLKKYESEMFGYFDRFSIISGQDAGFIDHPRSKEIAIVSNGVDFDSFYPRKEKKRYDICFMGNMSYPPNVEAIKYTVRNILPVLLKRKPEIRFLIAGAHPDKYIRQLKSDNIDVIEKFNHISDSIAMSRIMLSPMVVSIGLQNKVIQAMAMKVPNVVSKSASQAIQAQHNSELLEAEKPEEYADAIIKLLENEKFYTSITDKAFEFVQSRHNWTNVNAVLEKTIKGKGK